MLQVTLSARAVVIEGPEDRRRLMSAAETQWYRDQADSLDGLVEGGPIVEIFFEDISLNVRR